jgi:SAM-dependent methyltransferase
MVAVLSPEAAPGIFFPHEVNNSREAIIDNIRKNASRGLLELAQQDWTETPLMIVAGGPSVHDNLEVIKALSSECHILAVNGAYKFLRAQGIECEHFVMIDSREGNLVHVDSPSEDTHHCLASQVHPRVFDALADHRVSIFHLGTEATIEALGNPDQSYLTAPIGMASVHAIYVAAGLGYRSLLLFGYDFSQRESQQYAYEQLMNLSDDAIEIPVNGKVFRTTISLARTADQFVQAISPVIRGCDLQIQMYSEGLLPEMLKAASAPVTEDSERAKYEQMWGVDAYRKVSPGLECLEQALGLLKMSANASIVDFGCGTGRVVKFLRELGFDAVGVDIASNCLEHEVPFVQCALWDTPRLPRKEYGFSCDVLEHIPSERVTDTLKAIHGVVSIACYFNIDTIPDAFGVVIGKRLHLTVQPAEWWQQELESVWREVQCISADGRQAIFVCRK